jgi:molybdopterin-guanine dinucleotide biosynthesis adapter protein
MRILSVIGHKNAGKTTLLVALVREFRRQGKGVATLKHASHPAIVDREGTDTYRHFYEGCAEKTLIASPDLRVLFERAPDDTDPETLASRYLAGSDLVLVEGFRRAPIPKVEVYRKDIGLPTLFSAGLPNAKDWVAIVTDDASLQTPCRVLRFQDTMWLPVLAGLIWDRAKVAAS